MKKKAADESSAWEEFQSFATEVKEKEIDEEKAAEAEVADDVARRELEQAWYERKLGCVASLSSRVVASSERKTTRKAPPPSS